MISGLDLKPGAIVVDGTLGGGGHAREILKVIGPRGRLVGLDQDPGAIARARETFTGFKQASFYAENFVNLDSLLDRLNIPTVDAVILDVGFSSDQISDPSRGFSFELPGPLDMRMNPQEPTQARDLIRDLSEEELEKLFRECGNERWAKRFARAIAEARRRHPIESTTNLAEVLARSLPAGYSAEKGRRPSWARRHPATRVFQALRIAVNDELGVLERGLPRIWKRIRTGGRLAVMTFHSLEDRIVKRTFKSWAQAKQARLVTKKPMTPGREEVIQNPRSRSAKLRVAEKIV